MSVFIEDSARNLSAWVCDSVTSGLAAGGVITPWATPLDPPTGQGQKRGARAAAPAMLATGGQVWFDPMTHALQMPGVGDFRYYDGYALWAGGRGDLSDQALREEHVARVLAMQDSLGVPHLGPTILLNSALSNDSVMALDLAREAIRRDPECWLSVAGSASFWADGAHLDAHVGALDSLAPRGWFLTVARPASSLPVQAQAEEVHGLCRATRALSENAPVHISYGDLAALPAVAAGAQSVGTGWDPRQRVCSFVDYGPRLPGSAGGGWYQRPTLLALLGSLMPNEALQVESQDPALIARLGGIPPNTPRDAFDHHLELLGRIVTILRTIADPEQRYRVLDALYQRAAAEWPAVQAISNCSAGAPEWIGPVSAGLTLYARTEGW